MMVKKLEKQKLNMNKKYRILALLFVLSILSTTLITYQWARAEFSGAQEDLPYYVGAPGSRDYIIETNSTHVFAYNGTTGELEYSGSNATSVIQSSIDDGTDIFIKAGTYDIIALSVGAGKTVEGVKSGTILLAEDTDTVNFITVSGDNVTLKNLVFDGADIVDRIVYSDVDFMLLDGLEICNAANGAAGDGIVGDFAHSVITNCYIHDIDQDGFNPFGEFNTFSNNIVTNCGSQGVHLSSTASYTTITGNVVENCTEALDFYQNNVGITITGNYLHGLSRVIADSGTPGAVDVVIDSNIIDGSDCSSGNPMWFDTSTNDRWVISNNQIISTGTRTAVGWYGTHLLFKGNTVRYGLYGLLFREADPGNNTITDNYFLAQTSKSIAEENSADGNWIYNNYCEKPISILSTSKVERNYQGFVTENSGVAEASNGDTIAHGLAGTPDIVLLTIEETDANYFLQLQSKDATNIQIYLYDATAGAAETTDKTIHWSAIYVP